MKAFIFVLGIVLIIFSLIWYILFRIRMKKIATEYVNEQLNEFSDEDIIPEEKSEVFYKNGISWLYKTIAINTILPCVIFFIGVLLVVFN